MAEETITQFLQVRPVQKIRLHIKIDPNNKSSIDWFQGEYLMKKWEFENYEDFQTFLPVSLQEMKNKAEEIDVEQWTVQFQVGDQIHTVLACYEPFKLIQDLYEETMKQGILDNQEMIDQSDH